mgnify:CR=1 FL=1
MAITVLASDHLILIAFVNVIHRFYGARNMAKMRLVFRQLLATPLLVEEQCAKLLYENGFSTLRRSDWFPDSCGNPYGWIYTDFRERAFLNRTELDQLMLELLREHDDPLSWRTCTGGYYGDDTMKWSGAMWLVQKLGGAAGLRARKRRKEKILRKKQKLLEKRQIRQLLASKYHQASIKLYLK